MIVGSSWVRGSEVWQQSAFFEVEVRVYWANTFTGHNQLQVTALSRLQINHPIEEIVAELIEAPLFVKTITVYKFEKTPIASCIYYIDHVYCTYKSVRKELNPYL